LSWHKAGSSRQPGGGDFVGVSSAIEKCGHQLLVGIYNWFTEGFDTADLQEAKALLQELA
jgi:hypothetical protein